MKIYTNIHVTAKGKKNKITNPINYANDSIANYAAKHSDEIKMNFPRAKEHNGPTLLTHMQKNNTFSRVIISNEAKHIQIYRATGSIAETRNKIEKICKGNISLSQSKKK
ncbi:hypothetical protein ACFLZJ_00995 [Nanoarchaeota archaeon]